MGKIPESLSTASCFSSCLTVIYIDIPRILSNADLHKEYLILNNIFS